MKKSKCEKAAERYMHREFDAGTLPSVQEAYKSGGEALLRYAKKNQKTRIFEGVMGNSYEIVVQISKLEEWVKGEK